eukprot:g32829.t1
MKDLQHGLGVEETPEYVSYFGNFVNGKKSGRGVQMHLTKGAAGIEVLDANSRPKPLNEALEQELDELYKIEDLQRKSSPAMANQDTLRTVLAGSSLPAMPARRNREAFQTPRRKYRKGVAVAKDHQRTE